MNFTLEDETEALGQEGFIVSVVTRTRCYPVYESLTDSTDGILADIFRNFADSITPLIIKMKEQVNSGCWVRLSNGSAVCLDKDPTLEDASVDTDGDGIDDAKDLRPAKYDVTLITADDYAITFNSGHSWQVNSHTAEEIWDAHKRLKEAEYDLCSNAGDAKQVLDGDGIRFYLDSRPVSEREELFKAVYGRKTDYYQQKGLVNRRWENVSGYGENGFLKEKYSQRQISSIFLNS